MDCSLLFEDVAKDGIRCPKCKGHIVPVPPPIETPKALSFNGDIELGVAYILLDKVKEELINDKSRREIKAIEKAQQLIMEKVIGVDR
jgi:hypothetical protein